jgi:hypothetical protein
MFVLGVPLLIFPFAIYNLLVFLTPGFSWSMELRRFPLMSGAELVITAGDLMVAGSIMILLIEMFKAARLSRRTFVDHLLSMVLFGGMVAEFTMVREVASTVFFMLLVISFVDVVGGFAVNVRPARRDVPVDDLENVHAR